ncbi:primase-helicase family protein [Sulfurimonas sp.]|uniref:primase-helicase family protein n=1 Tax=Sulfurimonas sp. TaxID=2022749 RepID=UPI003561E1EB
MPKSKKFPISIQEFKYIRGKKYKPNIPKKIIEEDGLFYLNTAIPTSLMMLEGKPENEPKAILDLFFNLLGEKYEYLQYFLHWLAFNFAYGKKPLNAVILFGLEGVGKNILYYIMTKLYGEDSCSQINAESLKSNYKLAPYLICKRFVNFDEVTISVSKKHESFFKAVIANPHIELGTKVELHAQCLFTANYSTVFNIKEGDRRYSAFQTGSKLTDNNFLGFGSYEVLETKIDVELPDFAKYLKSLDVDFKLLEEPLETPEKIRIIGLSKSYLQDFHDALADMKIEYFHKLRNRDLLFNMDRDIKLKARINRANVAPAFNDLFGENVTTDDIMDQLRAISTEDIFKVENIKHSGSTWYIYPRRKDGAYFPQPVF